MRVQDRSEGIALARGDRGLPADRCPRKSARRSAAAVALAAAIVGGSVVALAPLGSLPNAS
jgi:hypothetical protein